MTPGMSQKDDPPNLPTPTGIDPETGEGALLLGQHSRNGIPIWFQSIRFCEKILTGSFLRRHLSVIYRWKAYCL